MYLYWTLFKRLRRRFFITGLEAICLFIFVACPRFVIMFQWQTTRFRKASHLQQSNSQLNSCSSTLNFVFYHIFLNLFIFSKPRKWHKRYSHIYKLFHSHIYTVHCQTVLMSKAGHNVCIYREQKISKIVVMKIQIVCIKNNLQNFRLFDWTY